MSISPGEDENADTDLQQHGNEQDVRMWRSLRFRDAEFEARYVAVIFASTRTESIALLIFGTFFLLNSSFFFLLDPRPLWMTETTFTILLVISLTFLISGKVLYGNRFGPQYKETAAVVAFIVGLALMVASFAINNVNPYVEDLQAAARVALNNIALDQAKEQPPCGIASNTSFVESVFFNEFYRADPRSVCQGILDASTSSACAQNGFAGNSCGVRAILCSQINYTNQDNWGSGMWAVFWYIMVATALQSLRTRVMFAIPVNLVCSAVLAATVQSGFSVMFFVFLFIAGLYSREKQSRALFVLQSKQHRELRRKSIAIKTTESKNAEMKAALVSAKIQLASKTLDSRLGARPPGPFTLDEFQDEYEARGGRNSALIDAVASVCSEWVFVSPIDDAKWSYFTTYIVPLPFWKETEHFARLQDIARAANAAITFHVTRMLEQISDAADGEHGAWLLDELDHINVGKRIADLSAWVEPKLLVPADVLSTPAAKQEYEVEVMPAVVRALANMLFESFKSKLVALSPDVHDEDEANHEAEEGSRNVRRYSRLELPIDSDGQGDPIALRCNREKSVKGAKRMGAKVAEAHAKGVPFPAINNIGDALRASLSTATCEGVRECWRLVKQNFEVIRMKNKFKDAIAELRSGGDLRTVSPNLHINCLFRHTMDGVERCIVVELQIYAKAILETKREAHKIYDVTRAKSIGDLLKT